MLRRLIPALLVALATTVPLSAQQTDISEDVGILIGVRGYAIGLMDYCHQTVAADALYIQARDTWVANNADASGVVDAAIVKLGGIPPADQAQVDKMISDAITNDVAAQADGSAFCKAFAEAMLSGSRDLSALANDSLTRARDLVNAP